MKTKRIATLATAIAALALAGPASAFGAPVLEVSSSHRPADNPVPAGSYAKYELVVSNNGDAATSGDVTVNFDVPAGMQIVSVASGKAEALGLELIPWNCSVAPGSLSASCVGPELEALGEPLPIEPGKGACEEPFGVVALDCRIFVTVRAEPGAAPGTAHPSIEACGGGAAACASVDDPFEVVPGGFTLTSSDGAVLEQNGEPSTQAGSHPYSASTEFFVPTVIDPKGALLPIEDIKDVSVELPPGVLGNPRALPTCTQLQLFGKDGNSQCPSQSQVGSVKVWFVPGGPFGPTPVPLYNMKAGPGTPALLAFDFAQTLVEVYFKVRTGEDYGVTALQKNAPQAAPFEGVTFTVWGVPGDPSHNSERACPGHPSTSPEYGCKGAALIKPFFTLPTSCFGSDGVLGDPLETTMEVTSWLGSSASGSFLSHDNTEPNPNPIGNTGCNALGFQPTLQARPTTNVADAASGLDVALHIPQPDFCDPGPPVSCEPAVATLRDTTVTLPKGLVINPAGANGLDGCSSSEFGFTSREGDVIHTTPDPATCPDASKLGTVEVDSPLVDHPIEGSVHIADPYANPFNSLLAIYITLNDPETGTVVKLAGEVHADHQTGRLTTTVLHNPQLPFEDFKLHFFGGAGGSLRTPATCGQYTTTSSLTPWSAPESGPPAKPSDTWAITQAPNGGACPPSASEQPFAPDVDAGTVTPIAGAFSSFLDDARGLGNGSQEVLSETITLPPGLAAKLAGVPYCPQSALDAAAAKSGREEEANPSCPAASEIGSVDVAAGAGPAPYWTHGRVYLTGPYKGAPLSVAVVTPAAAGPFDLGTVVVRALLHVDPVSARVTATTEAIPRILQGIPLDIRAFLFRADRPNFTLNGTSCEPLAFSGQLLSALGKPALIAERFQLGECGRLAFKPKLAIRLIGGTKRGAHPALKATLTMPPGGANIARASVALPHSEFLDQGHIGTVCTRVQFAADQCPAASVYGRATVTSPLVDYYLEGPVYLRSSDNELPDLVMALKGPPRLPIEVEAIARIDSIKGGIRSTFEGVPDLPVSTVVLSMAGGKKGLLQNSTNICNATHKATAEFDGQNGKAADMSPILKNSKCKAAGRKAKRAKRRAAR